MARSEMPQPWSVGFSIAIVFVLGVGGSLTFAYRDLNMSDPGRFVLFVSTAIGAAVSWAIAISATLSQRALGVAGREVAIGCGAGLGALLLLAPWWVLVSNIIYAGRPLRASAVVGGGACIVGLVGYLIARSRLARIRGGFIASAACALLAMGAFFTRATNYDAPGPLERSEPSQVKSPIGSIQPNLLLITIDTLRADHLPTYGYPRDTAPRLEEIGRRGIVFERAIAQRTETGPSLATLLTGTYPPTHRVLKNGNPLHDSNLTLAEMLKAKGYRTSAIISNPGLVKKLKFNQGFSDYDSTDSLQDVTPGVAFGSDLLNPLVFDNLERLKHDKFFLWVHYRDPHTPYVTPKAYRDLYLDDDLSNLHGDRPYPPGEGTWPPFRQTKDADEDFYLNRRLDFVLSQYDATIRFNDDSLGAVFDKLDEYNLRESTLVIIAADHGEGMGEHRGVYFEHMDPYEHTAHVPLIVYHPKLPANRRIVRTVSLVDVLPTVLDLLGLPSSPTIQGQSFAADILGDRTEPARSNHYVIGRKRRSYQTHAVTTDSHKFILAVDLRWLPLDVLVELGAKWWLPEDAFNVYHYRVTKREFYSLAADPLEERNLAGQFPGLERRLEGELWKWMEATYYEGLQREDRQVDISPEVKQALEALGYIQ